MRTVIVALILTRSATAYDRQTHALIRNVNRASRASNSAEVKKNADGSVDLYFGPKALFDKAWKLPDVEPVAAR
jgi:hypothetical protein